MQIQGKSVSETAQIWKQVTYATAAMKHVSAAPDEAIYLCEA